MSEEITQEKAEVLVADQIIAAAEAEAGKTAPSKELESTSNNGSVKNPKGNKVNNVPEKEDLFKEGNVSEDELSYKRKVQKEHRVIGRDEELKALEKAIQNDFAVLLAGHTGVGKTYCIQHLSKKYKKNMVRVSLNGEVGINELLGKWLVKDGSTYWQDGILTECMRKGDWIILDEINAALPEVLFCLNSLMDDGREITLAEKDNEVVVPHPDFRVFATMNPSEDYAGTKDLNPALLSRFSIVLWVEDYDPAVEKDILVYQSGIEPDVASILVDVGNAIRASRKDGKTWYICSTRDLVNWARIFRSGNLTLAESFAWSVFNKAPNNEKKLISEVVKKSTSIKFNWDANESKLIPKLTENLKKNKERLEKECQDLERKKEEIKKKIGAEIAAAIK